MTNKKLVFWPRKANVVEIVCNQPMIQDLEVLVSHVQIKYNSAEHNNVFELQEIVELG